MKLLIVEDEQRIAKSLARGLVADGFLVDLAHDGPTALALAEDKRYDVVLLDIMLPLISGYEVLRELRAREDWTPVLMISAKDGEFDLADALDLGADDYLVKPFSYVVLLARVRALVRRGRQPRPSLLVIGSLSLDPASKSVTSGGKAVDLSPREYELLEHLMRQQGGVASRSELLEQVFDVDPDDHTNIVEVYVGYLRRKLGKETILTVRSRGYRIANQ